MSDFNLNANKGVLRSISAKSPDLLTEALEKPRLPVEIISIVFGGGKYTAFYRSRAKIVIVDPAPQ